MEKSCQSEFAACTNVWVAGECTCNPVMADEGIDKSWGLGVSVQIEGCKAEISGWKDKGADIQCDACVGVQGYT